MASQPDPRRYEAIAETKIKEQERIREESPDTSGKYFQLSRQAIVFMRLAVILLIIVAIIIVYHIAH